MELSHIAKSISYADDFTMTFFVVRKKDDPTPVEFWYLFALDIDPAQQVSITFQRRGRKFASMSFLINPQIEIPVIAFSNTVTFANSGRTLNMFQAHISSDTVVFDYMTRAGNPNVFKFSLAGFKEKYLEQFV